ncbi:hypothetical protein IE077_000084 [Cardiosporidium cionae]|uniref:ABC transporter domain-containing protein n=1 Tax=Cardiosporidium cionae TaxID=476202 RepID=A0ABQ7JDG0_9APIC|nr:hypothetical protein IE077_000084 [Cardiosporidium cionae]|eukprot:KAF8822068.1 hypothetical protein IE077_000084 [Cardiosporidium cionae]
MKLQHSNSKFVGSYLFYSPRDHSGEAIMYLKPPSDVCIFANRTSMHSLPVHIQPLLDAAIKDKGLASYQSKIRNVPLSLPSYLTAFVITVTGMEALIIMFLIAPFPLLLWVTTEKKLQLKHLQFLSGVHPTTYWIINFLFDFILLLGILSLGVALYSWFSISYTTAYFTSSLYLMAALSALSLPWFAYAICYASDDYSKNQLVYSLVLIYCIILSVASFMIHFFGTSSTFNNLLSLTHWMGGLLPLYNISAFLIHLTFLLFTKSPLIDVTVDPLRSYILWICVDTLFYALLVISIDIWKIYISKLKNLRMGETSPFQGANNAANMSDVLLQGDALQAHAERSMEEAAAYQPRGESLGETLTVNNISKIYSKPCSRTPNIALQNTYFQMHPGTITSLVGPNGAGKSTLLNVLSGILEPSKGLVFLGKNALHLNPFRYLKSIVSCPQSNALWEELSPMEHLQLFAMMHGCRTAGLRIQLMQQFRHMGMERYANVRVKTLSGGTQRKLSVLISLLEPRLLCLMDEPTTGLDPIARKKFSYYIVAWLRCSRLPPINIISTHAVEEVEEISDRLMVVMKGNILFEGTIRQLKERYKWMRRLVVKFTSPTPEEKMYYKKKLGLENKQYLVFKELIHLMDEDMDKTPDLIYPYDRNCLEKAWEMLLADENRSTTVDQFLDWWCLFIKSHNLMTLLRKVLPYEIKQKNSQSLFFEFVITSTTDVDTYNIFRIFEDGKFLSDNHVKEYFFSCARLHDYVRIISDEDNE